MPQIAESDDFRPPAETRWPRRYTVAVLFSLGTLLCYLDRISISVALIALAADEHYDTAAQGLILSAFFWGYICLQLAGGWLADRFGGKRVLATGVAVWSLATFVTPAAAHTSFGLLIAARVLLGLGEAVNFPAIYSLTARWMPQHERARALSLNFSGMYLGTVTALIVSPAIITAFGWPALFYVSSAAGVFWLVAWMYWAGDGPEKTEDTSRPDESVVQAGSEPERPAQVPWRRIAREPAVWAIVLAHFCSNFGYNILLLWLPTYLNHTFGVTISRVGIYSLAPWIAGFLAANSGGWIADALLQRGVTAVAVRKLMQSIGFGLGALPLLILPFASSPGAAVALIALSAAASGLGLSGYGVNHLDIAPSYAGVLMGISNTAATIPGIVGVAVAGLMVQATNSFNAVFFLIVAVYATGMVGYLAWARGDRRI